VIIVPDTVLDTGENTGETGYIRPLLTAAEVLQTPTGCLKLWIVPNPVDIMFFSLYIPLIKFLIYTLSTRRD
jgi:hypothetical protein